MSQFKNYLLLFLLIISSYSLAQAKNSIKIIGFGDSLMAGYQLPEDQSFPAVLEKQLHEKGYQVEIINAGVSGDTTTGGLARLDWSIPDDSDLVILELGANDMLRGITPDLTQKNLIQMIERLKERNIPIILVGMLSAPNMGKMQAEQFNQIYPTLAEKYQLPLYPFFLDGVASHLNLQLKDGMHPNKEGVAVMVEKFLPTIEQKLSDMETSKINN